MTGHRRKEDIQYQAGWEQARFIVQVLVQPHLKKGKKFNYKFPWEKNQKPEPKRRTAADILKMNKGENVDEINDVFGQAIKKANKIAQ